MTEPNENFISSRSLMCAEPVLRNQIDFLSLFNAHATEIKLKKPQTRKTEDPNA